MALQFSNLGNVQQVPGTPASICTNPSGGKTYVKGILIHNTSSGAVVLKIYNVPNNAGSLGTAATSNRFMNLTVSANDTITWESPGSPLTLIGPNDAIFAEAATASVINVQVLGDRDV